MIKNTAGQVIGAQMTSATDGSAFTGVVTVYVTGDAGTQAIGTVGSGICTHEGNGFHTYTPSQDETNYDHIAFTFIGTGAIASTVQVYTSEVLATQASINALNDFNPATDTVARVTLVDTTTTNTDMRGTDNALLASSYIAPDNASIASILTDTGTTIPAQIDALNDPTAATIADAVWDESLTGATHNVPTSAGRRLRQLNSITVWDGIAQGAGTGNNQIQLDTGASAVNGSYDPSIISIVGGTGAGQSRMIYQYDGATRTATVDRNWRVTPDATSEFIIVSDAGRQHVNEGLAQGATATGITLNATASPIDGTYIGQTIFIRSGTGEDQTALILAYDGTTKVASIQTAYNGGSWGIQPDATSCYCILPVHVHPVSEIQDGLATSIEISALNDITASDVVTAMQFVADDFKADISSLSTQLSIDIISNNVNSILTDTNELQLNQNNWLTVDKSDLALELTSQDIKKNTNLIPATV